MAFSSRKSCRQHGFTLVELLVVIAIIGMLVALLLPDVQAVRRNEVQTQCLEKVKQLGLEMGADDSSKGQFPGYAQLMKRGKGGYVALGTPDTNGFMTVDPNSPTDPKDADPVSWATMLLPRIERQDYWDQIVEPN